MCYAKLRTTGWKITRANVASLDLKSPVSFTAKQCPFNMVYEESGSPCMNTCTHLDTSSLCEEHKMDGCFCPPGGWVMFSVRVSSLFLDVARRPLEPLQLCECLCGQQGPCLMTFPQRDASLSPCASANTTGSTTLARFTDRTPRSGTSKET